ncbi:MAG: GAF domain-containing protein [Solirubrobacteraceae bacterium]
MKPLDALDARRLHALIEAGRVLMSDLQLETVLDRLLGTAMELTGARFAAIGVLNDERTRLARFLTRGVDAETHRAIGDLPHGRGILGVLIEEPRALRLHDVSADPRSYGFPAGHPPMANFLGVPVIIRGEAWGNLYLTERGHGTDFDDADEAAATVLADWAAIAIENARLYESVAARGAEAERALHSFEATAAITRAIGAETDLSRVLELVVKRARALVHARSVIVLLPDGDELVVAAGAGQVRGAEPARIPVAGSSSGEVLQERRARRVDDVEGKLRVPAETLGVPDASAALLVPLVHRQTALGVLAAFDRMSEEPEFSAEDQTLLEAFAASAATAVAIAQTVEAQRLRQSLDAAEAERRRWARELHDDTLQALGGLKVILSSALRSGDEQGLRDAVAAAVEETGGQIAGLRALITELRPAALDELGVAPALSSLVQRAAAVHGIAVKLDVMLDDAAGRLSDEVETAIYRLVQEALSNVGKHAGAARATVSVREQDGRVAVAVTDDGAGFDPVSPSTGFGLVGMRERVALLGGTLVIEPGAPHGTLVRAELPARRGPQSSASSPRSIA